MCRKILAFYSPYPGAGKSTAAAYLTGISPRYRVTRTFALPLYHIVNVVLRNLNERFDAADNKELPIEALGGVTPRDLLIAFGRAGRELYPDIWVECMRRQINWTLQDVIIDDLRFPNEYAMLRKNWAKIVRITNPGREIVPSETEALLEGYEFDAEIVNDRQDIETYHARLDALVATLWPK